MFDWREAIAVYRGWQALEETSPTEQRAAVIDFDLVPEIGDCESFSSRGEVFERIVRLRDSVDVVDEETEFIRAKLHASSHYLRALQGEEFEFYEHIQNMLALTPELVSEETTKGQGGTVVDLLRSFSVREEAGVPIKESFESFDSSISVEIDEARQEAKAAADVFLPIVTEVLGFDDVHLDYEVQFVEEEAYWLAWASGVKDHYLLRFNFHPIHKWRRGDMEYLVLHEICGHFLQANRLANGIREKKVSPFLGVTSVHDPHTFLGEGIADALTYFFPDVIPLSNYAILSREQRNWRDYLNNNAHILINMGWSKQTMVQYLLQNPFTNSESVRLNLDRWRSDPLLRAYQYSYGIALKFHRPLADRMTLKAKVEYVRYAISCYVTPRRLKELARGLAGP